MASDNLSAVLYKQNDLRLEQRPIPEPKDEEALLQMAFVGICGSDVHYYEHGRIADFIVKDPMVIGHEASGVVVKVGSKVKHLKKGDRVAVEPGVPCRRCQFCKDGKYNLCPDLTFCATPPDNGNLARYYVHAADFCHKLPDHVSLEEGALLEPLSVGVHACRRANVQLGTRVLVIGAGPIGLVSVLAAKAYGAYVVCTARSPKRLEVAKNCGADVILNVDPAKEDEASIIERIKGAIGDLPHVTIDCSGNEKCISIGINITRTGGTLMLVGMGAQMVTVPLVNACAREIDIKSVFRYCNDYPIALEMVASGRCNVKQLVTHNFKLEETVNAFEAARKKADNTIKVMINCRRG